MADEREGSGGDISASKLDELTHAELLMLYQDSTVSVRFARERQWKLAGAALLLFTAMVAIPELVEVSTFAANPSPLVEAMKVAAATAICGASVGTG